jgi:hypothetical protein
MMPLPPANTQWNSAGCQSATGVTAVGISCIAECLAGFVGNGQEWKTRCSETFADDGESAAALPVWDTFPEANLLECSGESVTECRLPVYGPYMSVCELANTPKTHYLCSIWHTTDRPENTGHHSCMSHA